MPKRIQLQRTPGWRKPEGAILVARPSVWGNPWMVGLVSCGCRSVGECTHNMFRCATAAEAVEMYRWWIEQRPKFQQDIVAKLRGRDLCCWCKIGDPCHADVLLELANVKG